MARGHRRGQRSQREAIATALGLPEGGDHMERTVIFSKTKMCKFHILGICAKGGSCKFAHHKDELHPLPDLSRTKLCKTLIATGSCEDADCKYAHNREELRAVPDSQEGQGSEDGDAVPQQEAPLPQPALSPALLAYLASVPPGQVEQVVLLQQQLQAAQQAMLTQALLAQPMSPWAVQQQQQQQQPPQPQLARQRQQNKGPLQNAPGVPGLRSRFSVGPTPDAAAGPSFLSFGGGSAAPESKAPAPGRRGSRGRGIGSAPLDQACDTMVGQRFAVGPDVLQQRQQQEQQQQQVQHLQQQHRLLQGLLQSAQQPLWAQQPLQRQSLWESPAEPQPHEQQPEQCQQWLQQQMLQQQPEEDSDDNWSPQGGSEDGHGASPAEAEEGEKSPAPRLVVKNTFYDFEGGAERKITRCPRPSTWASGLNLMGRCASQDSMPGGDASPCHPGACGEADGAAFPGAPTAVLPAAPAQGTGAAGGCLSALQAAACQGPAGISGGLPPVPERQSLFSRKVSEDSETSTEVPPFETEKRLQDTPLGARDGRDDASLSRSNLSTLDEDEAEGEHLAEAAAGPAPGAEQEGFPTACGSQRAAPGSGSGCMPLAAQASTNFIVKNTFIELGDDSVGSAKSRLRAVQTAAGRLDTMG